MKYEEIKLALQKLSLEQIEKKADGLLATQIDARNEFVLTLFFIERNGLWRKSKQFKDSSFKDYIKGRFNITYHQYFSERQAIVIFPQQVKEIGIGNVTSAIKKCGITGSKKAFSEMAKIFPTTEKIKNEKVEKIIKKYQKQPVKPFPTATIAELQAEIQRKNMIIESQLQLIKEQEEIIKKLRMASELNRRCDFSDIIMSTTDACAAV